MSNMKEKTLRKYYVYVTWLNHYFLSKLTPLVEKQRHNLFFLWTIIFPDVLNSLKGASSDNNFINILYF